MYGYQDSGDLAPGKQGGKFGLNTGAFVTKFEYNPNAGSDGAAGDAIDFTVQIGEREYRHRFFPITKVFGKDGEITDTKSEEYKEGLAKETSQLNAMLTDIVKVFVDEQTLKTALATPISSFKSYVRRQLEEIYERGLRKQSLQHRPSEEIIDTTDMIQTSKKTRKIWRRIRIRKLKR